MIMAKRGTLVIDKNGISHELVRQSTSALNIWLHAAATRSTCNSKCNVAATFIGLVSNRQLHAIALSTHLSRVNESVAQQRYATAVAAINVTIIAVATQKHLLQRQNQQQQQQQQQCRFWHTAYALATC